MWSRLRPLLLGWLVGCGAPGEPGRAALGIIFEGDAAFQAEGAACLAQIGSFGGPGAALLDSLRSVPVRVRPASGDSSFTENTDPGRPTGIEWWRGTSTYACSGAAKVPCAGLLHELQHAAELYDGTGLRQPEDDARDEWPAVRMENWLLGKLGSCQRDCYDTGGGGVTLPAASMTRWALPAGQREIRVRVGAAVLCALMPESVTLTVENMTPNQILIGGRSGTSELLCGGDNPYFRAEGRPRSCALEIPVQADRNPYLAPLLTLVAYYPSGDPQFPRGGKVQWSDEQGAPEGCGANAFPEYCQIALGESGSLQVPLRLARPRARAIKVAYRSGG